MLSSSKFSAVVLLVAAIASGVHGHGQMTSPEPFKVNAKYRADCYVGLKGAGDQELQYAPVENLLERKQNQPFGAGFDVENGCRGMVADADTPVTELTAGKEFTVEYVIQAPHPGYLELAVVKPKTDSSGKVTYERAAVIKKIDNFATNSNDKSTTATIPTTISGCEKKGDCALQFYWHSDIAKQTYPTCASIIVKGGAAGGGGNSAPAPAPAPAAGGSGNGGSTGGNTSPTPGNSSPTVRPSRPSTPSSTPAPAPAPAAGDADEDCDNDLPEPDCEDDLPEPGDNAAGDADCDEDLPEPDCEDDLPEPDCEDDLPEPKSNDEYSGNEADVPKSNIGFGTIDKKGGESAPGKVSPKQWA